MIPGATWGCLGLLLALVASILEILVTLISGVTRGYPAAGATFGGSIPEILVSLMSLGFLEATWG